MKTIRVFEAFAGYGSQLMALERLQKRGLDYDSAKQRILNQMPQEIKMKRADEIIYNNGSLADLYNQVDIVINKYVR